MTKILQAVRNMTKGMVAKPVARNKSIRVITGGVHHFPTWTQVNRRTA